MLKTTCSFDSFQKVVFENGVTFYVTTSQSREIRFFVMPIYGKNQ